MHAFLGTRAAFNDSGLDADDRPVPAHEREILDGKRRVEVVFPPDVTLAEAFRNVTDPSGVWASHSPDPTPAWVSSDSDALAALVADHYGCEVRPFLPAGERDEFAARAHHFTGETL